MSTPDWEKHFAGLDSGEQPVVVFPGSRPPKPPPVSKQREFKTAPTGWDMHPRVYRVSGVEVELFPIRDLAYALGRSVPTIRSWEVKEFLPLARIRAPRTDGVKGHRLYSRAFIEGVQTIAEEERVLDVGVDIASTDFPRRVFALMEECGA